MRAGSSSPRLSLVGQPHHADLRLPHVGDVRLRAVGGEAANDLGRLDERVVGAEGHRAVGRRAGHPEPAPGDALLAGVDDDPPDTVLADGRPTAHLRQDVVAGDGVPVLVDHPLGTPPPARLLVGDTEVDQRALRTKAVPGEVLERGGHRRRDVQHVDGAAAPDLAVDDLAAERVARPGVAVDRHDVGVAHEAQRRRVGIGAVDAGDERPPTRTGLEPLHGEAGAFEVRLQQVGVAGLAARVGRAIVDALVADERLQEFGRLTGQRSCVGGAHTLTLSKRAQGGLTTRTR